MSTKNNLQNEEKISEISVPASPEIPSTVIMKKAPSKKKKVTLIITIIILLALLSTGGYFVIKNLTADPEATGSEQTAFLGMIESYIEGSAMTSANKREELGKELIGEVTEVLVKPGDNVLAGDLLLTVDPSELNTKLNEKYDELDTATLNLNDAQTRANSLRIVAPFNGKVVSTEQVDDIKQGMQISEGTVYATFADDSKMVLTTYFSYGYIDSIKAGQIANVSIPATTSNLEGKVSSVEKIKKISPSDGTILFKVNIELNNPGTLTKDMLATASIMTDIGEVFPAESGSLDYIKTQDIILKASGELTYKNVNEHYLYNAGDHLGTIKNDSLQKEVESNMREVETLQKSVDELLKSLANTSLVSPIDGQVSQISVSVGDKLFEDSTTVPVTVANLDSLFVDIKITEIDITKAYIGMPVTISYESTDGYFEVFGELTNLSLEAERSEDNYAGPITYFPAKILISDPLDLRPDMNIRYRMVAAQKFDIITVPVSAVIYTDYGTTLYVKKGSVDAETFPIIDETIPKDYEALPVDIGISDGYITEIITEIPDGTPIYVPNSSLTQAGMGDNFGMGDGMYYEEATLVG